MPVNRKEIIDALLAQLFDPAIFVTGDTTLVHWSQCDAQPAIFVRPYNEDVIPMPSYGQRPVYEMDFQVFLYCKNAGEEGASVNIVDLIDQVDFALDATFDPEGRQTLGGLVVKCWREGKTIIVSGEPNPQSAAVLPIRVLVNDRIVPRPRVASFTSVPPSGTVTTGDGVELTMNFTVPITISGGTPTLTLTSGGVATLVSPEPGQQFVFDYTVGADDTTDNLFVTGINLNGATAVDQYGKPADFTIPAGFPVGTLAVNPPA